MDWNGGLDWTGLDWTGLDWTGMEWNVLSIAHAQTLVRATSNSCMAVIVFVE